MSPTESPQLEAALAALDPAAIVEDVQAAVRIPSVTGHEHRMLLHLADRARALGLRPALVTHDPAALRRRPGWPGQEVARESLEHLQVDLPDAPARPWRPPDPGARDARSAAARSPESPDPVPRPRLAICAHVDVVDPGTVPWADGTPWSGALRDGHVMGRGSADMKGGLVAALHALAAVVAAGVEPAWAPSLLAVASEEDGGQGAWAALEHDAAWDACVIPEPTGFEVVCAQAGALTFTGTVRGVSAHAGMRLSGASAIDRYLPVHEALARLEAKLNADVTHPLMAGLDLPYPLVIGRLQAGHWPSSVPDRLTFEGRIGVPVGDSPEAVRRRLEAVVEEVGEGEVTLAWTGGQFAPAATDPEATIAQAALSATTAERGAAEVTGVPWGADMRLFCARGIPTVMLGTHSIAISHTVDEHVEAAEVVQLARILVRLLLTS